ncbi:MAG TPA: fumarylacetoacetate hydrolase family protein [Anaerolineales bacterium]|nr:fumarylacetoacetate hydrolase family protein [Anaerolineales bacterium]
MNFLRYKLDSTSKTQLGWEETGQIGTLDGDLFTGYTRGPLMVDIGRVVLQPPVQPSKVIAISGNYLSRVQEHPVPADDLPIFFFKPSSALIGHHTPIVIPPQSHQVEHEAELAVVIGKRARFVPVQDALQYVFGYTCANDVTARDLQMGEQILSRSKAFDSFCPLGPWLTTRVDPADMLIICSVNGQIRQMSSTREMRFSVPQIIAYLSSIMTLEPGDVILTGTPAGVSQIYPGDLVEVEIEGIGTLQNPVVEAAG